MLGRKGWLIVGGAIVLGAAAGWIQYLEPVRCGFCQEVIGLRFALGSERQMTRVQAHLLVCPSAKTADRRSLGDLARDPQSVDWARLRQEMERQGWDGGPHVHPSTIHRPGACAACDAYPDLQAERAAENAEHER